MITYTLVWRLREERGLLLDGKGQYIDDRLREILIRQKELMNEMNQLDREIKDKAFKELEEKRCQKATKTE